MNDYIITCSSTVDVSKEYLEKLDIPYMKFHFQIDGKDYLDDLGQTISYDNFYKMIASGSDTKTSQPNIEEYKQFFRPLLDKGVDILHIELSSGISGAYNSCEAAIKELANEYPNQKILVVDSLGASSGFGLLVDMASDEKKKGKKINELYNWLNNNKLNIHHWFFSTDLEHYKRGGRISKTAFVIGNILHINPLLNMDFKGRLIVRQKVRSKKRIIEEIVNKMVEHAYRGTKYPLKCFLSHSNSLEDALEVARLVEEKFPELDGKVKINNIGTTIGSHTGCGTVALFFYGDRRND